MAAEDKYRTDTLLAHLGRDPAANHGIVNPPVYHASTILFDSLESYSKLRQDPYVKGRSLYGINGTPTTFAFEDAVAHLLSFICTLAFSVTFFSGA